MVNAIEKVKRFPTRVCVFLFCFFAHKIRATPQKIKKRTTPKCWALKGVKWLLSLRKKSIK